MMVLRSKQISQPPVRRRHTLFPVVYRDTSRSFKQRGRPIAAIFSGCLVSPINRLKSVIASLIRYPSTVAGWKRVVRLSSSWRKSGRIWRDSDCGMRYSGSVTSGAVGGAQASDGRAVFDMSKGMWSSMELSGEGMAQLAGALSKHYKISSRKEISRGAGCDQAATGVSNPDGVIDHARDLANQLVRNALAHWPGTGENLYASYRHFHCPDRPQLTMIRDNLAAAGQVLGDLTFICLPDSADVCSDARGSEVNLPTGSPAGGASSNRLVQLCPSFFRMADDEQAGTLIAAAAKLSGVGDSHRCMLHEACYFDFLRPAGEVVGGNPYAYGYYALALSGWTFSREPERTLAFRKLVEITFRWMAAPQPPIRRAFSLIAEISTKFSRTRQRVTAFSGTTICLAHAITFTAKQECGTTCQVISLSSGCLLPERQRKI